MNRNDNMLLRLAQADAYAMAVEFCDPAEHPEHFEKVRRFERYHAHATHHLHKAGAYTDDTQMSIAVAEVLVGGGELTKEAFATRFFEVFKRDPRVGYSRRFQEMLETSSTIGELLATLVPSSDKNGACMRAVPLGVLSSEQRILELAKVQASVTHDTPGGILSAQVVGLMSRFALYESESFAQLPDYLAQHVPFPFTEPWQGAVSGNGLDTVRAVMTLLVEERSLMSILKRALAWGGDTDSVASIAWGIASARHVDEVLPGFMDRDLEPGGKYGPDFLRALGVRLMSL